jgi:hypothetical protein
VDNGHCGNGEGDGFGARRSHTKALKHVLPKTPLRAEDRTWKKVPFTDRDVYELRAWHQFVSAPVGDAPHQ